MLNCKLAVCYKCYHIHELSERKRCTNCKACSGALNRDLECLRFLCPCCGAGTYWVLNGD